ncbi:hypothetical protein [Amycolatopsis sp. RTGN1]|uniref:hypothetical protein n=1 Tax=Amycolatopsis ponsaeliensis TaxID=2992142 RepID=UPI00254FFDE4|nr:hypothetical protein [Amycolatopsis sp. RTGN1]
MNGGVLAVLVVMAVPVALIIVLLVSNARHNRRVRSQPERTVAGIRGRVTHENAEAEAANAPTEVLPVIQPAPADEPTVKLPPVLPKRTRPYVGKPTPYPRRSLSSPPADIAARVLQGLRDLDKE